MGISYFHEFGADSYKTSCIYYIRHHKSIYMVHFLLNEINEKLLILRDADKS